MGNDEFERLMEQALKSYSSTEPLAGLEQRVMGRVRGSTQTATWFWGWKAAAAALALILGIVTIPHRHQELSVIPQVTLPVKIQPVRKPVVASAIAVRRSRILRHQVAKLGTSGEEAALLHFIERDPEAAAKAFADVRASVERDLTVEPLRVEPIQVESLSSGGME